MPRVDIRSIRRRQILDAAERVAAQKGWMETTIADIRQEANVSTGVVTRHFKSKDEIMLAALEDILEQLRAQLVPITNGEKTLSENVNCHLEVLSRTMAAQPAQLQLLLHFIASSMSRPDIAQRLRAFFYELRQQNILGVKLQFEKQGTPDKDPVLLVNTLNTLSLGLVLGHVALGIDIPPEQLALHCANMLLKYFSLPQQVKG